MCPGKKTHNYTISFQFFLRNASEERERERVVKDRILRTRLKKEVCGRRLEKKVREGRSKRETEKICVRER